MDPFFKDTMTRWKVGLENQIFAVLALHDIQTSCRIFKTLQLLSLQSDVKHSVMHLT